MRNILFAIALFLALPAPAHAWEAKTKSVRDGDTVTVVNPDGAQVHVRLFGIDCPETKQPSGDLAKKAISKLAGRKTVDITPMDTDRYGRTVALLHTSDGTLVNLELVRFGCAWVFDQHCTRDGICAELRAAQAEARAERRGLWAEANPIPPWEWRKSHKTEEWYAKPARALKTIASKIKVVIR